MFPDELFIMLVHKIFTNDSSKCFLQMSFEKLQPSSLWMLDL